MASSVILVCPRRNGLPAGSYQTCSILNRPLPLVSVHVQDTNGPETQSVSYLCRPLLVVCHIAPRSIPTTTCLLYTSPSPRD